MPSLLPRHIRSWREFCDLVDYFNDAPAPHNAIYYRGQADSTWALSPLLLRRIRLASREGGMTPEQALELEDVALLAFRNSASQYIPDYIRDETKNTFRWWAVMQHFGAPTRLLDWTASAYVAAYFAVKDRPDDDGVVWLVNAHAVTNASVREFGKAAITNTATFTSQFLAPTAPRTLHFVGIGGQSDRMVAQQGIFSVSWSVLGDHGEILGGMAADKKISDDVQKLYIPRTLKPTFLRRLREMNVSAQSLFPGLDGSARAVDEFLQIKIAADEEPNADPPAA